MHPENNKKCEVINNEFELFAAYPNPFNDVLSISFNLNTDGIYSIELYDDLGKLILQKNNFEIKIENFSQFTNLTSRHTNIFKNSDNLLKEWI